eukprot:CAMPEP_0119145328 /NCGR_PEP_ID=MMETSP1310-20130426/37336_1 /TAXON_ID=464262 /ORGANISM="Genus nov. species nov., Strain RCC2339" /LENGTH=161 /DNA_ID=CAMNT_0007137135 /DNA_START=35 /DNA_END=516 /DNA_ORIENTATION=+
MTSKWFQGLFKRKETNFVDDADAVRRAALSKPLGFRHVQEQIFSEAPLPATDLSFANDPLVARLKETWESYRKLVQDGKDGRQATKYLKQFVETFNPKYDTWEGEFGRIRADVPNLLRERRTFAIPDLDLVTMRSLTKRMQAYVEDLHTMAGNEDAALGLS